MLFGLLRCDCWSLSCNSSFLLLLEAALFFACRSLSEVRTIINLSAQIVCGNGVFALGSSFLGLDNSELIGCDGSRYALCLSALHL